jgi:hypothetical protein
MLTVEEVNRTVRVGFEKNVAYVDQYLQGVGLDMGCGSCPLLKPNCLHFDISHQPIAIEQVGAYFHQLDVTAKIPAVPGQYADYIFSSHMIEDLATKTGIVKCILQWAEHLRPGGAVVLLIPDMQGGRYERVEEGGNPSHKINVGRKFFESIELDLKGMRLDQIDTIPHDESETMDVVFTKDIL